MIMVHGFLKYIENERKVYFMSPINTVLYIVEDVYKSSFDYFMSVVTVEIYPLLAALSLDKIKVRLNYNGNYIFTSQYNEVQLPIELIFDLLRFTTVIETTEFIIRALKEG